MQGLIFQFPRLPIVWLAFAAIDLNGSSTSNNPSNYAQREVYLYGHWGWDQPSGSTRIATTPVSTVFANGADHLFQTPRTTTQLEGNDSGSPAFLVWTDPDGGQELAIIGNHVGVSDTTNFHNFAGTHEVMAGINSAMTPDGYALRIEGEPTNTWVGSTGIC